MPDLSLQMQKQEQLNWCWAAVSASIALYYQDAQWQRQCVVVNAVLGAILAGKDCCTEGASAECNIPWDLGKALRRTGHLANVMNGPLSFPKIEAQIQNQRPCACRILSPGPLAHFVTITGCAQTEAGQQWVTVADPSPAAGDTSIVLYQDLLANYHPNGRWDQSYLTR